MTFPIILTVSRILIIPILILVYYLPYENWHWLTSGIFLLACLTDWLDGYLARQLKQTSVFGAFLDPVADKLVVAVALIIIVESKQLPYIAIPASVIIGREIAISALREWMSNIGKRHHVAVNVLGKVKTVIQMLALTLLLAYYPGQHTLWFGALGYGLLYVAAVMTVLSMMFYVRMAWREFKKQAMIEAWKNT